MAYRRSANNFNRYHIVMSMKPFTEIIERDEMCTIELEIRLTYKYLKLCHLLQYITMLILCVCVEEATVVVEEDGVTSFLHSTS